MSLRLQNELGMTDAVALAFAVVALQNGQTMDSISSSEFECGSLDAILSRGVTSPGPVQVQVLPRQLNNLFHHEHEDVPAVDSTSQNETTTSCDEEDDDYEKRIARSRERNREHARRTRLRKKAQLETLRARVKVLEAERQSLKQQVEECSIASILIGLTGEASDPLEDEETKKLLAKSDGKSEKVRLITRGKRKRFVSDAVGDDKPEQPPLHVEIDGEKKLIGNGKAHINWKTGVYSDNTGVHSKLSAEQLENLRRERNRMHAKMTRDRKKCYIATVEKTIEELESDVRRLKGILCRAQETQAATLSPASMTDTSEPNRVSDSLSPAPDMNQNPPLNPPSDKNALSLHPSDTTHSSIDSGNS